VSERKGEEEGLNNKGEVRDGDVFRLRRFWLHLHRLPPLLWYGFGRSRLSEEENGQRRLVRSAFC